MSIIYVILPCVIKKKKKSMYFSPPLLMGCKIQTLAGFVLLCNLCSFLTGEKFMVFLKLKAFYFLAMQF